jgi:hypothetical protein
MNEQLIFTMNNKNIFIDTKYDVRKDSNGLDPDKYSNTLKSYHKKLWSKLLPNGNYFDLHDDNPNFYLYHKSNLGEYFLSSDCIIHEYSRWKRMEHIVKQIPEKEITAFLDLSYTIGGFIIFPSNKVHSLPTMNQERGCNQKICDRIDLTLECIRLYYLGKDSPLRDTIHRYKNYFELFKDFKGYCKYFLLQDLISDDYLKINFFLPFNGFESSPLPDSIDEYYEYKKNNIKFVTNRNNRIKEYNRLQKIDIA